MTPESPNPSAPVQHSDPAAAEVRDVPVPQMAGLPDKAVFVDLLGVRYLHVKTSDGGENWQKLRAGPNDGGKSFTEVLVIDDESPNQMYAGTRGGDIYSSDDGGESWRMLEVKVSSISDMKCVHA